MAWMNFSDGPFAEALVWTILHSMWQFVIIALGMSFLLKMYQNHKSSVRYYISLVSMFVALLTFVLTFIYFYHDGKGDVILFPERKLSEVSAIITQTSVWDQLYAWIQLYQKPIFLKRPALSSGKRLRIQTDTNLIIVDKTVREKNLELLVLLQSINMEI